MPAYNFSNLGESTLSSSVDSSTTTWPVVDGSVYPASNFFVRADSELALCTSRSGNNLTVVRNSGAGGTLASHSSGATVKEVATKEVFEAFLQAEALSSTRGATLYRGASAWAALAFGTAGQTLKTGGSGADPSWDWVDRSSIRGVQGINGLRITPSTGVECPTSNVTAVTQLYAIPDSQSNDCGWVSLYESSAWVPRATGEISAGGSLSGLTADRMHDLFLYWSGSALTLDPVAWTNNTTRATALVKQDGVWVKSGATSRRWLGSFCTTSTTGQTEFSPTGRPARILIWNYYNQRAVAWKMVDPADTWSLNSTSWRNADGSASNQFNCATGLDGTWLTMQLRCRIATSVSILAYLGIGANATTPATGDSAVIQANYNGPLAVDSAPRQAAGYNYYQWAEKVSTSSITVVGDNGGTEEASRLQGVLLC